MIFSFTAGLADYIFWRGYIWSKLDGRPKFGHPFKHFCLVALWFGASGQNISQELFQRQVLTGRLHLEAGDDIIIEIADKNLSHS